MLMNCFIRFLSLTAAAVFACFSLSGCGSDEAKKKKIEKEALSYNSEKYGFQPTVTNVTFLGGGDLTPMSVRKSGGNVYMEYQGKTFRVAAYPDEPQLDSDDYMRDEILAELNGYLKQQLGCSAIYCDYTFAPLLTQHKEDKTWQDCFRYYTGSRSEISISTYELDKEKTLALDTSVFGEDTKLYISDWTTASEVNNEITLSVTEMPESRQGLKAYYYFHDGTVDMRQYK